MHRSNVVVLAVALLCGCSGSREETALVAQVQLAGGLRATCVLLQVRGAGDEVLLEKRVPREPGAAEIREPVYRGALPEEIRLAVRPLYGSGCADPIRPNGPAVQAQARFTPHRTVEVPFSLEAPPSSEDEDKDGFAGSAAGGPDCADNVPGIHPGAAEQCLSGVDMDCNGQAGCGDVACAGKACGSPPAALAFVTQPQRVTAATCSNAVIVQTRDAQGAPRNVAATTPVSLSASAGSGLNFYSDPGCTTGINQTAIPPGASSAAFYFRGGIAGPVSLTAGSSGIGSVSQTALVESGPPVALAIVSAPQTLPRGTCSSATTVAVQDAGGNPVAVDAAVEVNLASATNALTFYADSACTLALTRVTIPTGASQATFHFRANASGQLPLLASADGLTPASQGQNIIPAGPMRLAFNTIEQTRTAGNCSGLVVIEARDDTVAYNVPTATAVGLSATPSNGFAFYSDTSCTNPITSATIPAGASSVGFYFRGTAAGTISLTAVAAGYSNASQKATIAPGPMTALAFLSPPRTITAGTCSAAIDIQAQDAYGNATSASTNTSVSLSSTPSSGVSFSTTSSCNSSLSTVVIPAGSTGATFYFKSSQAGPITLKLAAAGVTGASQVQTVNPGAPAILGFSTPAQTVSAGSCSGAVTVRVLDGFGNPTSTANDTFVDLSVSPSTGFALYADATCSSPITGTVIPAGNGSATFHFRSTKAGSATLTASATGLAAASQTHTTVPGSPVSVTFITPAQTRTAGSCSSVASLQLQDAYGNPSTAGSITAINLAATPGAGFTFYSDSDCTNPVTSVSIPAASDGVGFYFAGTKAGKVIVTASTGSLGTASQEQTITPGAPTTLAFSTAPQTLTAGTCSAATTVGTYDAFGNPSPVTNTVTLTLTAAPSSGFSLHATSSCNTALTDAKLTSGSNSFTFYFRGTSSGSVTITATASGYTTASQTETITPAAPSTLAFLTAPQVGLPAGKCSSVVTVGLRDVFGNPANGSVTVNLSASSGPGSFGFFADANCSTLISSITIPSGTSSASFYFLGISGGQVTLTASSPGLTSATQTAGIVGMIRSGGCSIPAGQSTVSCTISPALTDLGKAFLVFQATNKDPSASGANVMCGIASATSLTCSRAGATSIGADIQWYIPQFSRGVSVQHYQVSCSGLTTSVPLATPVDPSRTFLLLSSHRPDTAQSPGVTRLARLTSSSTVDIVSSTICNGDKNALQVVEMPGAVVLRGTTGSITQAVRSVTSLPASNGRAFLLYSYRSFASGDAICDRAVRGEISNATTLTFSRGDGNGNQCDNYAIDDLSWERVQLPIGYTVQQLKVSLSAGTTGVRQTIGPIDPTRTLVFTGGQWASGQLHGEGSYAAGTYISEMRAQLRIANDSEIELSRATELGSAAFTAYVVELVP